MHSTDEALRMRGQLPAIPSTATVHQTIQTVSRELRLILEIPRPAERQFVSFEIGGHRQGRAGNLFYNRSECPWFHELPALTVATSMHAGVLYQYNPYVTIYLLAETHVVRPIRLFYICGKRLNRRKAREHLMKLATLQLPHRVIRSHGYPLSLGRSFEFGFSSL